MRTNSLEKSFRNDKIDTPLLKFTLTLLSKKGISSKVSKSTVSWERSVNFLSYITTILKLLCSKLNDILHDRMKKGYEISVVYYGSECVYRNGSH